MNVRRPITKTDELDVLSGIWTMSCNDDNPIMTYRSVAQRLNLPDSFDLRGLVQSRPELFREGILKSRLDAWKDRMKSGKSRPNWIVEIKDTTEQHKAINALTRDDVFRNQFRVAEDAEKCGIQIIEWGLQHIDRLRKASAEEREARSRRWTSIIIPLASLFVAATSVVGSAGVQWLSTREAAVSKRYEVNLTPKQRAYSSFMDELMLAASSANALDNEKVSSHINGMEAAYYLFEPFLDDHAREEVYQKYKEFGALCVHLAQSKPTSQEHASFEQQAAVFRKYFRDRLFAMLFVEKPI